MIRFCRVLPGPQATAIYRNCTPRSQAVFAIIGGKGHYGGPALLRAGTDVFL